MVEHVLDVAAALVVEVGFEEVVRSPTLLLDRTGVSRGSFYAFFETPEAVLDELAYRRIKLSVAELENTLGQRPGVNWTESVNILIDFYEAEHRLPLIRELWVRQNLTQRARELDESAINDMAGVLLREFRKHDPHFPALTELQCCVAIHSLERLCQFAFRDNPLGDSAVIGEARRMLTDYFAGYFVAGRKRL
ncbi:transcriptional regulator [Rhodococcus triatomae BKS 15-14]|nr:transcriptional regulator [Rhodococcus triatomae BKS 15-14]